MSGSFCEGVIWPILEKETLECFNGYKTTRDIRMGRATSEREGNPERENEGDQRTRRDEESYE